MQEDKLLKFKSILYCTQSNSLNLFNDFNIEISKKCNFKNTSFIVADSKNYFSWIKENPDFETDKSIIKEWDITSKNA